MQLITFSLALSQRQAEHECTSDDLDHGGRIKSLPHGLETTHVSRDASTFWRMQHT